MNQILEEPKDISGDDFLSEAQKILKKRLESEVLMEQQKNLIPVPADGNTDKQE